MIFSTGIRIPRWLSAVCFFLAAISGTGLLAQDADEKPEIFTRVYPDVKEFHTPTFRPVTLYGIDESAKLPPVVPITTGKSDGQLVDEIELLRTSNLQPRFVAAGQAALSGVPIVAADVTADGKTLVTYDSQKRLTTWSLPAGEKLVEFPLENPSSQAAVAIASDGSKILFGDSSTNVLLLDAKTAQVEFTHELLENPIGSVAFSPGGTKIAAVDIKGNTYIAEPQSAGEVRNGRNVIDLRPLVDVSVGDSGNYATAMATEEGLYYFDKVGFSKGSLSRSAYPAAATAANDRQLLLVDHELVALLFKHPINYMFTGKTEKTFLPCHGARFDSQNQTAWITTEGGIDVRVVNYLPIFDLVRYPQTDTKTDLVLTAPDENLLLMIGEEGQVELFRLEDNQAAMHAEMMSLIHAMINEYRWDAIELLAKRWAQVEFELYDKEMMTMYFFLADAVRAYRTNHWPEKNQMESLKKYVFDHPDCEFFRVVLTMETIETAWDCRGRGFAGGVDEQEYKYFKLNLEQATNMLMPLFQRDEPPCPEAYVQAMELAKVDQWDGEAIAYLMAEAQANAPTYSRIYGEAAVGLMPRWGGAQDSSVRMAEDVCDELGGDDGDILYASIARWVFNYHGWTQTFDLLGFSKERVMQGYAKAALRDSTRQNMNLTQALRMAFELQDKQTAQTLAEHFESIGAVPVLYLWSGGLKQFEAVMSWALDRPYQFARIEAKLPELSPEDLAPTPSELAKVEEMDALAHGSDKAAFVQENSFSIGDQRPRIMEVAGNGSYVVAIDHAGDLQVWDVATGKAGLTLTGDDAPGQGVVDISHRGDTIVIGKEDGSLEKRDVRSGQILYEADGYAGPIVDVGMSPGGQEYYAVDSDNQVIIIRNKDKRNWDPKLLNPKGETLIEPVSVAINERGHYLQGRSFQDRVEVGVMVPTDKGVAVQKATVNLGVPAQIVSGRDRFAVLVKDLVVKLRITASNDAKFEGSTNQLPQIIRRAKFTKDTRQIWFSTDRCIDIRNWEGSHYERPIKLPSELESAEWIRLAPDAGKFVHVDDQGMVTVWKLEGNVLSNEFRLMADIVGLINQGRYNTFELLGDRWASDNTPGYFVSSHNMLEWLIQRYVQIPLIQGEVEAYEEKLNQYLEARPDARLMRLILFELKYGEAQNLRADQGKGEVPRERIAQYQLLMQECKEILTPLMKSEDVPPQAYAAAIRLGRELGWDRSQTKAVLDKGVAKAPEYARLHAEAAVSLTPKYGGKPEDAQRYAAMVADRIGGEKGDLLYSQIALFVSEAESWPLVFDEFQFSRERVLRGLVSLAQEHPRRYLIRNGLQLAKEGNDQEAGAALAKIIEEEAFVPYDYLWPKEGDTFDNALKWANGM